MPGKDIAVVASGFHLAIPETVRSALRLRVGQEIAFVPRDGGIMIVPIPERETLAGFAKGARSDGYRDRDDRV